HAIDFLVLAIGDGRLDTLDAEDDDPVLLICLHARQIDRLLRIVAGSHGILALVVGIDIVEIAIDKHLPGHFHRVAVNGRKDATIFGVIAEDLAIIGDRDTIFAIGEDVAGAGIFLHAQAMDRLLIGNLDDLVTFHDVAAHARDPRIGLVVHEQIAPVIGAIGE